MQVQKPGTKHFSVTLLTVNSAMTKWSRIPICGKRAISNAAEVRKNKHSMHARCIKLESDAIFTLKAGLE